jgi:hypothetical protein
MHRKGKEISVLDINQNSKILFVGVCMCVWACVPARVAGVVLLWQSGEQ